jgi:hypothetical protein
MAATASTWPAAAGSTPESDDETHDRADQTQGHQAAGQMAHRRDAATHGQAQGAGTDRPALRLAVSQLCQIVGGPGAETVRRSRQAGQFRAHLPDPQGAERQADGEDREDRQREAGAVRREEFGDPAVRVGRAGEGESRQVEEREAQQQQVLTRRRRGGLLRERLDAPQRNHPGTAAMRSPFQWTLRDL